MNQKLFRKKSIDKVTSPDQLNDYIKVANPGVWMLLMAVIVLLCGTFVWGFIGHLETVISTAVVVEDGGAVIYVKESDAENISVGMTVRTEKGEFEIIEISESPSKIDGGLSEYAMHASGLSEGEWVYTVKLGCDLDDGIYKADLIIDSVSPIYFILN